jgi:hypothetical protein
MAVMFIAMSIPILILIGILIQTRQIWTTIITAIVMAIAMISCLS